MMTTMLATNIEVSPAQMGVFIGCLIVLATLFLKVGELKKSLVNDVLTALGAQRMEDATNKLPQQVITRAAEACVERDSFHKHAELNRGEHTRIEQKFDGAVNNIQADVAEIAVQVGQIKVMREANGKSLETLNDRVADLVENMGELSGAVHQALVTKQQPRRRTPRTRA